MTKQELLRDKLKQKDRLDSEILELKRDIFRDEVYGKIRKGSVCKVFNEQFTIRNICVNMNNTVSLNKTPMAFRLDDIEVVEY